MAKKEVTIQVTIKVKVKVDENMPYQDMLDEFGNNADYNIGSTDNIEVVKTEWIDSE